MKAIGFYNKCFGKFLWLNPRAQFEHLSIQLFSATAQLLFPHVSPFYLLDDLISLFLMLLNERRMLGQCKIQDPQGRKASPQTFLKQDWVLLFSVCEVFLDDKANISLLLFHWELIQLQVMDARFKNTCTALGK